MAPGATASFPVEPYRYHVYVGLFCPFSHRRGRVILVRELKGLQQLMTVSIVKPYPKDNGGWRLAATDDEYPGSTVDHLYYSKFLHELYFKSNPFYVGKYSVPVLWDKKTHQIVNNESEDIMFILNVAFRPYLLAGYTREKLDTYPHEWREKTDEVNSWLMPDLSIGVYKAGFADTQETYEKDCRIDSKNWQRNHPLPAYSAQHTLQR